MPIKTLGECKTILSKSLSKASIVQISVNFDDSVNSISIFGLNDKNIHLTEKLLDVEMIPSNNRIIIKGSQKNAKTAETLVKLLADSNADPEENELKYLIRQLKKKPHYDFSSLLKQRIKVSKQGKIVRAKSIGQADYLQAFSEYDIIFGIGPAGTGKTYLAMAYAVNRLISGEVARIVLTRPVVEAGESLGFLPGDMQQKVNPYLRPLHDAIYDMIGYDTFNEYNEREIIEVAPLAYMRGRTLNNSIVILDEAQNTTKAQMKMFLTRLGLGSKAIITGDITQSDLPSHTKSGLLNALKVLQHIKKVKFVWFTRDDVVRHQLVQDIINAYEIHESSRVR